jgi:hypothetical protein
VAQNQIFVFLSLLKKVFRWKILKNHQFYKIGERKSWRKNCNWRHKVVERGKGDKIYINTSGIGLIYENAKIGIEYIKPKQSIIINRDIASHGMAIMSERKALNLILKS